MFLLLLLLLPGPLSLATLSCLSSNCMKNPTFALLSAENQADVGIEKRRR